MLTQLPVLAAWSFASWRVVTAFDPAQIPAQIDCSSSGVFTNVHRRFVLKSALPIFGIVTPFAPARLALASSGGGGPTQAELMRIKDGYSQIQYLLSNFDSETTICRENGGECKRDAEPVRRGEQGGGDEGPFSF